MPRIAAPFPGIAVIHDPLEIRRHAEDHSQRAFDRSSTQRISAAAIGR
jgi:hypothetical protein